MKPAMTNSMKLSASALALLLTLPALAAPLPAEHHEHGITWISGGIGSDESQALKAESARYPLSLVFSSGKSDEYLADVRVVVKDQAGKTLLNTVSGGPLMLIRLPAGKYEVSAVSGTRALQRSATVAAHGDTQVSFHWHSA